MQEINTRLLENFKLYFPSFYRDMIDAEVSGPRSIIVTCSDGIRLEYHDGLTSIKILREQVKERSEEDWRRDFQYKLNKKMSDAGLHITQLAVKSGVSLSALYKYLNLERTPNCWTLTRLAEALNCDPSELV